MNSHQLPTLSLVALSKLVYFQSDVRKTEIPCTSFQLYSKYFKLKTALCSLAHPQNQKGEDYGAFQIPLLGFWGPGLKQEIALMNLVPRRLEDDCKIRKQPISLMLYS
jgi:hypothetical protein